MAVLPRQTREPVFSARVAMSQTGTLSPLSALTGSYRLRPGQTHSIVGSRPVTHANTLVRVLRGQTGPALVRTVGSLFSLCAHAHQRVAALVFNAASPCTEPLTVAPLTHHRLETVRDHLRCMALDWPARLQLAQPQARRLLALAGSPVMQGASEQMTSQQVTQALAQLHLDLNATDHLLYPSPLPVVGGWTGLAERQQPPLAALDVLSLDAQVQNTGLRTLAQAMTDPDFVQAPIWRGRCAETGAWTRLRHRASPRRGGLSAWTRLTSRWQEVLDIAAATPLTDAADQDALLSSGAMALGEHCAIAWCEMARGLLCHWAKLDDQGRVADYRVLAPTEWNFHPKGSLATALAALSTDDVAAARCLAAAFDACVACEIATPTDEFEPCTN